MPQAPKLVNRGAAGLLSKLDGQSNGVMPPGKDLFGHPKDRIKCAGVPILLTKLTPDPLNARVHNEKNWQAIMESLALFGQMKPITVRKENMTVMAGNGTVEAAKRLGWTKLACSVIPMTDAEAAGFGVADNRTAELATWDFEVLEQLDAITAEEGLGLPGWTHEELMVLRRSISGLTDGDGQGGQTWQELWEGMPDFVQDDVGAKARVSVSFRSEEDFDAFLLLIGQSRSNVTNGSIWHPRLEITDADRYANKRWVAAEEVDPGRVDSTEDDPADVGG